MLAELQDAVLRPEAVDYVVREFSRQLEARLASASSDLDGMQARKEQLEGELYRLAAAVAETGHSAFLLKVIGEREQELMGINE